MNFIKRISVLVCICLLCSVNVFGAGENFTNYCDIFEEACAEYLLSAEPIDENNLLDGQDIILGRMDYTARHIPNRDDYATGGDNYSFPAEIFEKWATTFFNIKIDDMRSKTDESEYHSTIYNPARNTYDCFIGGYGGGPGYMIYGYTENSDGTYSVYMKQIDWFIESCSSLEEFYEKIENFEECVNNGSYTGEIVFIDGLSYSSDIKGYFPVEGYHLLDVEFDGSNVKYLKSKKIESIPDIENIIKPDTESVPDKPIDNIVEYEVSDGISIQDNKCFSNGTIVKAESITSGDLYEQTKNAMSNIAEKFSVYDFSATKDGQSVQPNGKVKVTFSIPNEYSDDCSLYHVDINGTVNKLNSTFDKASRTLTAELEYLGVYVVADEDAKSIIDSSTTSIVDNTDSATSITNNTKITTSPQTDDNSPLYLLFILISMSGIILFVISKKCILKRHK